jgi:hypothetical protein
MRARVLTALRRHSEVCARCPLVMTRDLLSDLVEYKKSKSKGVMMASRSLIALFRDVAPQLLHRRDRGKDAAISVVSSQKGCANAIALTQACTPSLFACAAEQGQ